MPTITTNTYLDGGTSRTAGETWTINSSAVLTIRTDTRVHANAPSGLTGTLGNVTVNDGEIVIDARNIRWLPYDTGGGNVPGIGTTITQGAVSGYFLGVWSSLTAAPTASGSAMPASGFIKFREVTGGNFTAGALTSISGSATSTDVLGWLEAAFDLGSDITLGRLGKNTIKGGRFYVGVTDGTSGQQIQCPSSGSSNIRFPGLYIENTPSSNNTDTDYTMYMGINYAATGWSASAIGGPWGATDRRACYVKQLDNGVMQIGEDVNQSSTYASRSALSFSYASRYIDCTYTWANGYVSIYTGGTDSHLLDNGYKSLGFTFTTGDAIGNDGLFTAAILSPYHLSIPLAGSGSGGTVRVYLGIRAYSISTNHYLLEGENVRMSITSGTLPDGSYSIYAVYSSTEIYVEYPHYAALSGGGTLLNSLLITFTSHGLVVGKQVYLDFTSGGGVDGVYTVKAVASTSQYYVYMDHTTSISGDVTVKQTIGYVPPSGCRIWIPNVFIAEATTGARSVNTGVSVTALANRTSWFTTSAGSIDFEYASFLGCYLNFSSAYAVYLKRCLVLDVLNLTSIVSDFELDCVGVVNAGYGTPVMTLSSIKSYGIIKNSRLECGGSSKSYLSSSLYITYSNNIDIENTFINSICPIASRDTASCSIRMEWGTNFNFSDLYIGSGYLWMDACSDMIINGIDYIDLHSGLQNSSKSISSFAINYLCTDVLIDNFTIGLKGTVKGTHPYSGIIASSSSKNLVFRNLGTESSPIDLSGKLIGYSGYGPERLASIAKDCDTTIFKRIFVDGLRYNYVMPASLSRLVTFENVDLGWYIKTTTSKTPTQLYTYGTDSINKGIGVSKLYSTALSSVYGMHFVDIFTSNYYGQYILLMNEPTDATSQYFTVISGVAKFNSNGGCLLPTVGCNITIEDPYFRKGHTGFSEIAPTVAGGTMSNYDIDFQVDTGNGFGNLLDLSVNNLTSIEIDPSVGFRMRYNITTLANNSDYMSHIYVHTTTTSGARQNYYPLDVSRVVINSLISGSEVKAYKTSDNSILYIGSEYNNTVTFDTDYIGALKIEARKASSAPFYVPWITQITTVAGSTVNVTALQRLDQ